MSPAMQPWGDWWHKRQQTESSPSPASDDQSVDQGTRPRGIRHSSAHVRSAAWIMLVVLLVLGISCGCKSAWQESEGTCPFIGPDTVAKAMEREVRSLSLYMTANGYEVERVWKGCGKRVSRDAIRQEIDRYLITTRLYQGAVNTTWATFSLEFTNPDAPRLPQKVVPFKLCLVSICPTVVIMIPFDHKYNAEKKQIGRDGDVSEWGTSICGIWPLAGGLHAGTSFPYEPGILWFRPDHGAEPEALSRLDERSYEVKTNDVHLVFVLDGDRIRVTRLK